MERSLSTVREIWAGGNGGSRHWASVGKGKGTEGEERKGSRRGTGQRTLRTVEVVGLSEKSSDEVGFAHEGKREAKRRLKFPSASRTQTNNPRKNIRERA